MPSIYDPQSQRNPAWSGHPLGIGVPGATIGAFGCFITSAAMILTHFLGRPVNPLDVDAAMDQLGLYVATPGGGRDLWPDGAIRTLFNHFLGVGTLQVTRWDFRGVAADLSKLAMGDADERMIVVDFDHNPNDGIQTHALRVFGWDGKTLMVDDPWYGSRDNFSLHYGTNPALTIQAIVGITLPGFVPPWKKPAPQPQPQPVDPCADLRTQVTSLSAQVQSLSKTNMDQAARITAAQNALK